MRGEVADWNHTINILDYGDRPRSSQWMQVIVNLLRWLVSIVSQQRSGRCSISNGVEQGGRIGCEVFGEEPSTASVTGTACLIVHGEQAHMRLYACMLYL